MNLGDHRHGLSCYWLLAKQTSCVCDSLCVISVGFVALEQRLHEDPQRSRQTHQDKDPQEQTVNHHGYVLPVLYDLEPNQQDAIVKGC